jgi:hypothetical protein
MDTHFAECTIKQGLKDFIEDYEDTFIDEKTEVDAEETWS